MMQKLPGKGNYKEWGKSKPRDGRRKGWNKTDPVPPWRMKAPLDPDTPGYRRMKREPELAVLLEFGSRKKEKAA